MPQPYRRDDETDDRFKPSQQGKRFLEEHLKETSLPPGITGIGPKRVGRPDTGTRSYDERDIGGTDFEIGEYFDEPYNAIEADTSGEVEIETATGDHTTVTFSNAGDSREVSVRRVLSSTIALDQIILYRY